MSPVKIGKQTGTCVSVLGSVCTCRSSGPWPTGSFTVCTRGHAPICCANLPGFRDPSESKEVSLDIDVQATMPSNDLECRREGIGADFANFHEDTLSVA